MNCLNCDAKISTKDNYCPNCGECLKDTRQKIITKKLINNTEILENSFYPLFIAPRPSSPTTTIIFPSLIYK